MSVILGAAKTHGSRTATTIGASRRMATYAAINFGFLIFILGASLLGDRTGHDPALYLILLVSLFTTPILFLEEPNGKYAPLLIGFLVFFVSYGLKDIVDYFITDSVSDFLFGRGVDVAKSASPMTEGEVGILSAFVCLSAGYSVALATFRKSADRWLTRDWSVGSMVVVGLACFSIGLAATWYAQFFFTYISSESEQDPVIISSVVLARMLEPVGAVLLSYAYLKTRSRLLFVLVVGLIILKLPMGIVLNSKEIGFSFLAVFFLTTWIYDGKVPVRWMLTGLLALALLFPLAYTYRAYIGTRHISVRASMSDLPGHLEKAFTANTVGEPEEDSGDKLAAGIDTFASRSNLKPLMDLIMARAGVDLPYQGGHTLEPLLYVFIPRLVMPDKPEVKVGQFFNREFHISESPHTYISTSFMGEFYWNYAWPGLVIGMFCVGFSYGMVGQIANIVQTKSVTRLLIMVSAIYLLVIKFETGIAEQYSVFIRSVLIILLLHALFRRRSREQAS